MKMPYLMLSAEDAEVIGTSSSIDGMGILAIWSERGRDFVPHLTEQTTEVRGFQILVEAFRLWEVFQEKPKNSKYGDRLEDFFILIEQAFARTIAGHEEVWDLPGRRRAMARRLDDPQISVVDHGWHLLGAQKANGLWGLYRGASQRAGLLSDQRTQLSPDTFKAANEQSLIVGAAQTRLFDLVRQALDGGNADIPPSLNSALPRALFDTYYEIPLRNHLRHKLIDSFELNRLLAERLIKSDELDRRKILSSAARDFRAHKETLTNAIRCENLLSIVEQVFYWLCASKNTSLELAVEDLPVDLEALARARDEFSASGLYEGNAANARHTRLAEMLDPSNHVALARSILELHRLVSEDRGRDTWVWEEGGLLRSDLGGTKLPDDDSLKVGSAWTNDYYLYPLQQIARQLEEAGA